MQDTLRDSWEIQEHDFPSHAPLNEQLRFLLGYAVLAPSTRNTQPWKFSVAGGTIGLFADFSRWQPVADAGRRELYLSLGCALENLLVAAGHFGFHHELAYLPDPGNQELVATVSLGPGGPRSPERAAVGLETIRRRRADHGVYLPRAVPSAVIRQLEECVVEPELRLDLITDSGLKQAVDDLNLQADVREFADPEFRKELGHWIGQGVFGTSWLLSQIGRLAVSSLNLGKARARKDSELVESAPVLALVSARTDERRHQVKSGQALERLWLLATELGLSVHPMSQALELPDLRREMGRLVSVGDGFPMQLFRLGYAKALETGHTPRRPVEEVLIG